MVPKHQVIVYYADSCFRAVLFRMVPKPEGELYCKECGFRAVLFRMVPKQRLLHNLQ